MIEHGQALPGPDIAPFGDGNNVLHSILEAAGLFKFNVSIATPAGYEPDPSFVAPARNGERSVTLTQDASVCCARHRCNRYRHVDFDGAGGWSGEAGGNGAVSG